MKKFAQIGTIAEMLDVSIDYIRSKEKEGLLIEGLHYFYPPHKPSKSSKKAKLYDIQAVEEWVRSGKVAYNKANVAEIIDQILK